MKLDLKANLFELEQLNNYLSDNEILELSTRLKIRAILSLIIDNEGIKAREIAEILGLNKKEVNHILYYDLAHCCTKDNIYNWHIKQEVQNTEVLLDSFFDPRDNIANIIYLHEFDYDTSIKEASNYLLFLFNCDMYLIMIKYIL